MKDIFIFELKEGLQALSFTFEFHEKEFSFELKKGSKSRSLRTFTLNRFQTNTNHQNLNLVNRKEPSISSRKKDQNQDHQEPLLPTRSASGKFHLLEKEFSGALKKEPSKHNNQIINLKPSKSSIKIHMDPNEDPPRTFTLNRQPQPSYSNSKP